MLTTKQKELIENLNTVKASAKTRTEYNAYQQMLTRIRKFGHGAIEDLLYLTQEPPKEEIAKIFTRESMDDLFKMMESIISSTEISECSSLSGFVKSLMKYIMKQHDLEAHEMLKIKYSNSPSYLRSDLDAYELLANSYAKKDRYLCEFIKKHHLKEEYLAESIQLLKADKAKLLKRSGWTDTDIDKHFGKEWEESMAEVLWGYENI